MTLNNFTVKFNLLPQMHWLLNPSRSSQQARASSWLRHLTTWLSRLRTTWDFHHNRLWIEQRPLKSMFLSTIGAQTAVPTMQTTTAQRISTSLKTIKTYLCKSRPAHSLNSKILHSNLAARIRIKAQVARRQLSVNFNSRQKWSTALTVASRKLSIWLLPVYNHFNLKSKPVVSHLCSSRHHLNWHCQANVVLLAVKRYKNCTKSIDQRQPCWFSFSKTKAQPNTQAINTNRSSKATVSALLKTWTWTQQAMYNFWPNRQMKGGSTHRSEQIIVIICFSKSSNGRCKHRHVFQLTFHTNRLHRKVPCSRQ